MTNANTVLDALADPTRRRIFELVAEGPVPVGVLAQRLPVTRPAVSQHLRALRDAGLVRDRPQGTRRLYVIDPDGLEVARAYFDDFWRRSLLAFKHAAERSSTQ